MKGPLLLIGHSLGGLFIWVYEQKYPDQVAGLIFLDAATPATYTGPLGKALGINQASLKIFSILNLANWASKVSGYARLREYCSEVPVRLRSIAVLYQADLCIASHDTEERREVSALPGRFGIVVGADGLHSNTRALVFGPEEPFNRYLGRCFNLFSVPKPSSVSLSHEGIVYAEPGRAAGIYAVGDSDTLHAFLIFAAEEAPFHSHPDIDEQRKRTSEIFAGSGWKTPRLVEAMQSADDLFFDTVSQIHMPHWSSGRVVLVGDAAYAPSFLSGQGTSLALIGAYVLAGELGTHSNPAEAFASYERIVRPFVEANQALASSGGSMLLPRSQEELDRRNQALAAAASSADSGDHAAKNRQVHNSLKLPNYDHLLKEKSAHD